MPAHHLPLGLSCRAGLSMEHQGAASTPRYVYVLPRLVVLAAGRSSPW